MTSTVGLVLGDLDLMDPTGSPFSVTTEGEGTNWGNPQPIEVAVRSLLQDGSIVVHQGDDNREVALRVVITAPDSAALAEGEAALMAELYRANTLTYTPADGWGPATVFTVITSSLAHTMDDLGEVRGQRTWSVRLVCKAFGNSEDEVTATALPTTGTTTTNIDAGAATTGWTGSHTVTSSAGSVRSTTGTVTAQTDLWLLRTIAAVDLSTQKYVVVDWSAPNLIRGGSLSCQVDGVAQEKVAEALLPSGLTRSWFLSADTSATTFRFAVTAKPFHPFVGSTLELAIDKVDKSDQIPQLSTGRQLMRYVDIYGSARTQGVLTVSHASTGLGEVIVYTRKPDGSPYTPPLRVFKTTAGATTVDATTVSGAYENDLSNQFNATIPKRAVPDGTYVLLARLKGSTAGAAVVSSQASTQRTTFGLRGNPLDTTELTLTTSWKIYQIGPRISLPTVALENESDAQIKITLLATSGVTTQLDEAWLFNITDGSLTWVDLAAGAGGYYPAATKLWLFPADVATPRRRMLRGTAADLSDAVSVSVADGQPYSWGEHEFPPGELGIFTVTTGPTNATVTVRYPPAWHTHAGL